MTPKSDKVPRGVRRVLERGKAWRPKITLDLKPGLFTRLSEGAKDADVSITVWVKAILMDFTHIHVGLTNEPSDKIRSAVRGHG